MKNVFKPQKSILWIVLVILTNVVISCTKSEPEPPLADQVVGNYTSTSYTIGTVRIIFPATNASGITATARVTSTKVSEEVASFTFVFTQTKSGIQTSSNSKLENLTLKKASSGEIEGYNGAAKVAIFKDNELTLIFTDPDPSKVLTLYSKKDA
ncbi:MAG: hypothetical protein R2822_04975 [Spirosomataceae bacterium]